MTTEGSEGHTATFGDQIGSFSGVLDIVELRVIIIQVRKGTANRIFLSTPRKPIIDDSCI